MGLLLSSIAAILGFAVVLDPTLFASLINLLPAGGTLPTPVHSAAIFFGNALNSVSFFLPVADMVLILSISYSISIALLVFYWLRYIINFFRGIPTAKYD